MYVVKLLVITNNDSMLDLRSRLNYFESLVW